MIENIMPTRIVMDNNVEDSDYILKNRINQAVFNVKNCVRIKENGYIFLDFGKELNGGIKFTIMGNGFVFGYTENAGKLIIAGYSGDELADVELRDIEADSFIRAEFEVGSKDTIKAFVWDSAENMSPACAASALNIR